MQAVNVAERYCPDVKELENPCLVKVMLVLGIVQLMFVVDKGKGAQHSLNRHCILVPLDVKKIQPTLPRNSNIEHI